MDPTFGCERQLTAKLEGKPSVDCCLKQLSCRLDADAWIVNGYSWKRQF